LVCTGAVVGWNLEYRTIYSEGFCDFSWFLQMNNGMVLCRSLLPSSTSLMASPYDYSRGKRLCEEYCLLGHEQNATCWLCLNYLFTLLTHLTEEVPSSETSVNFYQTTQCHTLEDSTLHSYHCENLKSHKWLEVH
jgi:hypothetical protein